jgi:hypothetical protein
VSSHTVAIALAYAAWALADSFLLLGLAGAATYPDWAGGTRFWVCLGILAVFFGFNALTIDTAGPTIGF